MIEVITSMNQRYYDLIGKDCIESFLKYWPESYSLTVYVEEVVLEHDDRIKQISFSKLDKDYAAFQADVNCTQSEKKFAKKAYSYMHALHNIDADWIIWLDADVITTAPLPESVWPALMDHHHLTLHMGVTYNFDKAGNQTGEWFVPETGVYATNKKHSMFEQFRDAYSSRYYERNRDGLRRYYDNDVFGAAVKAVSATHRDLCFGFKKSYKTPLPHTVLAPYLTHYKAKHSKVEYSQTDYEDTDDQ